MMVALLLVAVGIANAQKKSEFSVSYGVATSRSVNSSLGDAFDFHWLKTDNASYTGAVNMEYMYRLNSHWAVGVDFGYEHAQCDAMDETDADNIAKYKDDYFTVMLGGKYYWINGAKFRIYSKAAVGVSFVREKMTGIVDYTSSVMPDEQELFSDNATGFAYQVSPVALEIGKDFCGFLELGYGNQGVVQAGIRVRF